MDGNYQSIFLIPFTTYALAENEGGLTIGSGRRAEVGITSLNLEFGAHMEVSCLLISPIFLLHLFFLLPACSDLLI